MDSIPRMLPTHLDPALATLAQVLWVAQIALLIHMYRTGRPYWWTYVLFAAPGIGGLAYVLVEIAPDLRGPRGFFYSIKPRKWRIADRRTELEDSETVGNRLALAEELFDAGEETEAHEVAQESLRGVFKDDPHTMAVVARYKLALHDYDGAYDLLQRIDTARDRMLALRVELLTADALFGLGRYDEAEPIYRGLVDRYSGDAPRAGLAQVYEKTGRIDQARATWTDVRARFRRASPAWRRTERRWYRMATARLKALKVASG